MNLIMKFIKNVEKSIVSIQRLQVTFTKSKWSLFDYKPWACGNVVVSEVVALGSQIISIYIFLFYLLCNFSFFYLKYKYFNLILENSYFVSFLIFFTFYFFILVQLNQKPTQLIAFFILFLKNSLHFRMVFWKVMRMMKVQEMQYLFETWILHSSSRILHPHYYVKIQQYS